MLVVNSNKLDDAASKYADALKNYQEAMTELSGVFTTVEQNWSDQVGANFSAEAQNVLANLKKIETILSNNSQSLSTTASDMRTKQESINKQVSQIM